jgi:hypothetical protein
MGSLGASKFIGLPGLHSEVIRRLDAIAQQLDQNQGDIASLQKTSLTPAQAAQINSGALNIQNAIGSASSAAAIPTVTSLPANVSTVGAAVVFKGQLYTWTGSQWIQAVIGTISDTAANMTANYPPAYYPNVQFYQTDRTVLYLSTGANWIYVAGAMIAAAGSRPSLGSNDKGFLFIDSGSNQLERWDGSAWHNVA